MELITVPLPALQVSPANVRKTVSTGSIDELAKSIHSHGLLQNLSVVADDGEHYQVIAGGLRLRALQKLAKDGLITERYPVPCNLLDAGEAAEASLAENVTRSAMHPADEFDAFNKLATGTEKASAAEIAARFGKSERYVLQRMRLANVAPEILKEYRAGKATLEQMMALALTDDQAAQARIWKSNKHEWQRRPGQLRRAITEKEVTASSKYATFIGLEAYENAGGQVRRDLFGEDNETYLVDAKLVERLVVEKLEKTAQRVRKEGWKWVESRPSFEWQDREKFGASQVKAHAGVVVHLNYSGNAAIERGLVRPEDRKAAGKSGKTTKSTAARRTAPARKPGELTFAAVQRLQAECGSIVALDVARNNGVALRLLAAELADGVFYQGYDSPRTWVHIKRAGTNRMGTAIARQGQASPAYVEFANLEKTWRAKLPKKRGDLRAWILEQELPEVLKLVAFLIAREIDVVDFSAGAKDGIVSLAAAASVDLTHSWKVTGAWLATLPKSTVLAMAKEAGAKDVDLARLGKLPKAQFASQAAECFPASWLPKPLRPANSARAKKAKRTK